MTLNDPESSSDSVLPEQRVGMAMREARESAGVSLRKMAKQLGYHSHTTLSSYERGAVMPTDEAVSGYERVLGLTSGSLTSVLEEARIDRHGDAWAKRRVHIPIEFVAEDQAESDDELTRKQASRRWYSSLSWWVVMSGGLLVLGLGALIAVLLSNHPKPPPAVPISTVVGVRDGSDPKVTGCSADGTTLDSVDVYDPPQHLVGELQLRGSSHCGTSWGRFVPTAALAAKPPVQLEIDVYRPADGAAAKFHLAYDGLPAYGNMLISKHECVYAQLALTHQGRSSLPPVQTACREAPGG